VVPTASVPRAFEVVLPAVTDVVPTASVPRAFGVFVDGVAAFATATGVGGSPHANVALRPDRPRDDQRTHGT
jgi:hypothetical protein